MVVFNSAEISTESSGFHVREREREVSWQCLIRQKSPQNCLDFWWANERDRQKSSGLVMDGTANLKISRCLTCGTGPLSVLVHRDTSVPDNNLRSTPKVRWRREVRGFREWEGAGGRAVSMMSLCDWFSLWRTVLVNVCVPASAIWMQH